MTPAAHASIEDIALHSGFGTTASLRVHFSSRLNTSPTQYRREFSDAETQNGPNDRHRIFDYGTNKQTRQTCRYLHNINN